MLTIRLILHIDREIEYDGISFCISITIQHFEIDVLVAVVRYNAVLVEEAVEDGLISVFWKLVHKDIAEDFLSNEFGQLHVLHLQRIHYGILTCARNAVVMLKVADLFGNFLQLLIVILVFL